MKIWLFILRNDNKKKFYGILNYWREIYRKIKNVNTADKFWEGNNG